MGLIAKIFGFSPKEEDAPLRKRKFEAAKQHRTLSGWQGSSTSNFDVEIAADLNSLRARSRDSSINSSYARRYFSTIKMSTIGPNGISLKMKVKESSGAPDKAANEIITEAFAKWAKSVTPEGDNWINVQNLFIGNVARDGEILIQILRGQAFGPYQFALKLIEPDHLDATYDHQTADGNIIRASIEYDSYGKRVAYWLWEKHPGDKFSSDNKRIRIPASNIIHGFMKERSSQNRGFPWISAALTNLEHLKQYQQTELIAARVASAKMGFYTKPAGGEYSGDGEDEADENAVRSEVEPGVFEILPDGWNFSTFDTDNPNGNFEMFNRVVLKAIASSLNIAYHTLSGDLSQANSTSLRAGLIGEREYFKTLQTWVIDILCKPVFEHWLEMAMLTGQLGLPIDKFSKFNNPEFQARSFASPDPHRDAAAVRSQLEMKTRSYTDVIRETNGRDFRDVMAEIATEQELMEQLGIVPKDKVNQLEILKGFQEVIDE